MSGTGKRNPDDVNMPGVSTSIIVGAILVAASMVLLVAYFRKYMLAEHVAVENVGMNNAIASMRAAQRTTIDTPARVGDATIIPIAKAMELVAREAKTSADNLVPAVGPSNKPTAAPVYGRPQPLPPELPKPPPLVAPAISKNGATQPAAKSAGSNVR